MARKLRFEAEGGMYHVINRGNHRNWVFESEGAKVSFAKTLAETCERSGWVLHAWVIMGNHFHLAVETPHPNLSEGMRWLQSVFAGRFNHFRKETGHIFQGRFKSIPVENLFRMGWLSHYIHLNPVRAGICKVEELKTYRFGSYAQLWVPETRPKFLDITACLEAAGGLTDTSIDHQKYADYLAWLAEDEPTQKEMNFAKMSKGWALGGDAFRKRLVGQENQLAQSLKLGINEAKQVRETLWEVRLRAYSEQLIQGGCDVTDARKAADWKVAVAAKLKEEQLCRNGWLSRRLAMGAESAVSRYCTEMHKGMRPRALKLFEAISSNSMD